MKDTVRELKQRGARKVGVWMALQGYWFGIDPEGELAETYNCQPHPTVAPHQPRGGVKESLDLFNPVKYQWLPSPDKAVDFWIDYFTLVKSWGVDFVKVNLR